MTSKFGVLSTNPSDPSDPSDPSASPSTPTSSPTSSATPSILQVICAIIAKIAAGIALIMTCVWCKNDNIKELYLGGLDWEKNAFNWHPVLMVAGFGFSLTFGVTSFRSSFLPKSINKALHVISYIFAIVSFSIGLKAVWKSNEISSSVHLANLYSLHSWIGIITIILFGQNFLLGGFHFLNPATSTEARKAYHHLHVFLGTLTFLFAVIAIETGHFFSFLFYLLFDLLLTIPLIGLTEKTTLIGGCSYQVTSQDTNPSEHYDDIPEGCKLSQGIGLMIIIAAAFTLYSIWPSPPHSVVAHS